MRMADANNVPRFQILVRQNGLDIWMFTKVGGKRSRGRSGRRLQTNTLAPEFCPPPYMQTMPYTKKPLADRNEICNWIALRDAVPFV